MSGGEDEAPHIVSLRMIAEDDPRRALNLALDMIATRDRRIAELELAAESSGPRQGVST